VVDDTPPATVPAIGAPTYSGTDTFVTSASTITLTATDGGVTPVGVTYTEYRIDGGPWNPYGAPFTVAVEGSHMVNFRSMDRLGSAEAPLAATLFVDDTPPATTITPGAGTYAELVAFALAATDAGSGVARTEYAVDGGSWITYTGQFTLAAGDHVIAYRSTDRVDNQEADREVSVHVGTPPPPAKETNWKPLVAAVFAAILAVAGAWSSRRSPWTTGSRRQLRAFLLTAVPFVLAESATGVLSHLSGFLSIPPIIGAGTAVDVGILVAGLAVSVNRVRRAKPPR